MALRRTWLLLPWLPAAACVEYNVDPADGVDVFTQSPADQIDILLIVDNSGSMAPYQAKLGDNFDSFIGYFVDGNVDYHIGITTTDDGTFPETNGAAGRFVGDIITPETDDADAAFRDLVNVGTSGSGLERGLDAALLALDDDMLDGDNAGFLREDATLSVIFVSDEEDGSIDPVNDYIDELWDIKGQRRRNLFNASALTVIDEGECTPDQAAASSPGTRYVDVAEQTHGLSANLCAEDFGQIVSDLSLAASALTGTYFLSGEPRASSLTVTISPPESEEEGEEIPCSDGVWTYTRVDDQPAVVFDPAEVPETGSRVAIRYMDGDGDPAGFCTGEGE